MVAMLRRSYLRTWLRVSSKVKHLNCQNRIGEFHHKEKVLTVVSRFDEYIDCDVFGIFFLSFKFLKLIFCIKFEGFSWVLLWKWESASAELAVPALCGPTASSVVKRQNNEPSTKRTKGCNELGLGLGLGLGLVVEVTARWLQRGWLEDLFQHKEKWGKAELHNRSGVGRQWVAVHFDLTAWNLGAHRVVWSSYEWHIGIALADFELLRVRVIGMHEGVWKFGG